MSYKWKPPKTQRRAFAERMNDQAESAAYNERKLQRANRRRATSSFDYEKAGGNYIPTKAQHDFCLNNPNLFITPEEDSAANMVIFGYSCNEKISHDYIHIVNEIIRRNPNII